MYGSMARLLDQNKSRLVPFDKSATVGKIREQVPFVSLAADDTLAFLMAQEPLPLDRVCITALGDDCSMRLP